MSEFNVMMSPLLWTLVSFQLVMGAFDVVYHHELTERLAWRPGAAKELTLHAARNLFYAVLFAVFAWCEPRGAWAWVLIAVLLAEIVITLADFVEEDMSRKLPATERVLHTLLAINYGALLALAGPEILRWASMPAEIAVVSYGWGSWVLTVAAAGVLAFAIRDLYTSHRAARFVAPTSADLRDLLPAGQSVLVTGGTGFIGSAFVDALVRGGHEVTVLTRDPSRATKLTTPLRFVTSLDQVPDNAQFDAIVDLAGEPVADGLWTRRRRFNVIASRVRGVRAIGQLMQRLEVKPRVIIKASAIGRYGVRDDDMLTEVDAGTDMSQFAVRSCAITEAAALRTGQRLGVRVVNVRIGLVLGRDGGMLGRLLPVYDLALGGPIGNGRQWMSWISLQDVVRLMAFAIGNDALDGAVNATAPKPVRNREFAAALGRALNRPAILPVPAFLLEWVLGDVARELLTGGQRVLPAKATAAGFRFVDPSLDGTLTVAIGKAVADQTKTEGPPVATPPRTAPMPHI
jgi:uncharacterized protein